MHEVRLVRDAYCDSLKLLVASRSMAEIDGVAWAGAVMGTPSGLDRLIEAGVEPPHSVGANDLVLAVVCGDPATAQSALAAGASAAFERDGPGTGDDTGEDAPRTIDEAVTRLQGADVAIISVPGPYAAVEAHHALTRGLHVLLFSDNVPLEEERELKLRARALGLLVMGPGAGTAILSGTGLGFSNAVLRGPVGVVAAAGTGAQEVSALLSRWGVGVSHVIGVGGRDLSAEIGGLMTESAIQALENDPHTKAILVVSKPPDRDVAAEVLKASGSTPVVATFLGLDRLDGPTTVNLARTLEDGAKYAAALVGAEPPVVEQGLSDLVSSRVVSLSAERRTIRGYYSGGTLCYEAQQIIGEHLGAVYSNQPLDHRFALPAPAGSNVLLDLGAEEYTQGRPHPMIDQAARIEAIQEVMRDPEVAVVLLDVVLGYGSHEDPAGELIGVCEEIMAEGGPLIVAYVLGTDEDTQGYADQRAKLESAGCLVTETAARSAHVAAAIASRNPRVAEL